MPDLVKPTTCRRCSGKGYVSTRVVHSGTPGGCFTCGGSGKVEGDKDAKAAAKAQVQARTALGKAASAHSMEAHYGLGQLEVRDPSRLAKAVASFAAGRTDVLDALVTYGKAL